MDKQLDILIVEDDKRSLTLLRKFIESLNHNVRFAENGEIAYQKFLESKPDLILTDLNMPVVNGKSLIKKIRADHSDDISVWVSIIILSAYGEEGDIIDGLDSGADDYLTKPINLRILRAKISAVQRNVLLQKSNAESLKALEKLNHSMESEQILAKKLADQILNNGDLIEANFSHWLCPAAQLSGDFITAKRVGNKLYVMVADSTGHGLAAALPTLAMARSFNTMSERGFSIETIVAEINRDSSEILPVDRFVAAAIFMVDLRHKIIECWNGGFPTALVLDNEGNVIHEFKSNHLALSILNEEKFNADTEIFYWSDACQLITFSDGLIDAEEPMGKRFGDEHFMNVLAASEKQNRFENLKQAVLQHIDADRSTDDILLAIIDCD
jgi:CheY-like chemotaxis protein